MVIADANDNYSVTDGVTTNRTYDFVAATTGNAVASTNSVAPGTRWVKVSETGTTPLITTHVFDIKAEQRDLEINSITLAGNAGQAQTTLISAFDLYQGSCPADGSVVGCTLIGGGTVTSSGTNATTASTTIAFSSLSVPIAVGTKQAFTVKALFADEDDYTATSNSAASTTVYASADFIGGIDKPNFNTLTVTGSNANSGDVHAVLVAPTISNASLVVTKDSILEYLAHMEAKFTIKANGGALYLSKTTSTLLGTSTTASAASSSITTFTADTCSSCGDTSAHIVVPDGASRTITLNGDVSNQIGGTAGTKNFKITNIYFDDDTSGLVEFSFDVTFPDMNNFDKNFYLTASDVSA